MSLVSSAAEVNTLAESVPGTGGVYFVTAFSGLLAPYWDPGAAGLLIGLTAYTTPAHIALASIEANAFQTREILESMQLDSKAELDNKQTLCDTLELNKVLTREVGQLSGGELQRFAIAMTCIQRADVYVSSYYRLCSPLTQAPATCSTSLPVTWISGNV